MRKFFLLTGCVWTMLFTACDNTDYSDHSPFDNSAYLSVAEIRNVESFTFNRRVTEQTKKFTAKLTYPVGVDVTVRLQINPSLADAYNAKNDTQYEVLPARHYTVSYTHLVQTGYVRNYGFEAMLSYGHRWGDFGWDSSFTFSTNKNEIVELVKDYIHPESGKTYNVDKLELKTDEGRGFGKAKFILKEGGTLGDLYTHADLKRDINGNVLVDNDGNVTAIDNAGDIKLGSVLPKANLAWNNSFSYKGVNVGFLLTARLGGIAYSATQAYLDLYGVSETSAAARCV